MRYALLLLLLLLPPPALAQEVPDPLVTITLHAEGGRIEAGQRVTLAVAQDIAPGWHTYYRDPGDSGIATRVRWDLPEGFAVGALQWPAPQRFEEAGLTTFGYTGQPVLLQTLTAPAALPSGPVTLVAHIEALACRDICVPVIVDGDLTLNAGAEDNAAFFRAARAAVGGEPPPGHPLHAGWGPLWAALAFAFLGGLILNLMPCVFPVLALKALSLVNHAERGGAAHALAYAAGVIATFLVVASALLVMKATGAAVGWGFHLQNPVVVVALTWLLFAIGLSLSGLLQISLPFSASVPRAGGLARDFATGALVTLVATPCTAPFMAVALGYALVQPPHVALSVFAALGAGLAAPYVALALAPGLARLLPKPGAWMEAFRRALAFPIYATAAWLAWVLAREAGADALGVALIGALLLALAAWLGRRWALLAALAALALLAAALPVMKACAVPPSAMGAQAWSPAALDAALAGGGPVFVEATADWCITCKVNHALAINRAETRDLFARRGVTYLVADWTDGDPAITEHLAAFGRQGVPLYVFYPGGGAAPRVLPQILPGPGAVRAAVEEEEEQ